MIISETLENLDDRASRLSSVSKEICGEKSIPRHFTKERSKEGTAFLSRVQLRFNKFSRFEVFIGELRFPMLDS